jgi:hypothetical protein
MASEKGTPMDSHAYRFTVGEFACIAARVGGSNYALENFFANVPVSDHHLHPFPNLFRVVSIGQGWLREPISIPAPSPACHLLEQSPLLSSSGL